MEDIKQWDIKYCESRILAEGTNITYSGARLWACGFMFILP